jgi:xanthosine utilization system XapX-like protein
VLAAAVEAAGVTPPQGAVLAFPAGLAAHDALAPRRPAAPWSAALGALGILGGLAVQLAVMDLFSAAPYGVAAPLGGAAAAFFAFLTRRRGAFADDEPRP